MRILANRENDLAGGIQPLSRAKNRIFFSLEMTKRIEPKVEGIIKYLSKEGLSSRVIVKRLKDQGISVSKSTVNNVVKNVGKWRQAKLAGLPSPKKRYPMKVALPAVVTKVKIMTSKRNPPSLTQMSQKLKVSRRTVQRIIQRLKKEKRKKYRVHRLSPKHIQNRKTNCRKLYEKVLAGQRSEYVVTLDEALFGLENCNGERKICYITAGQDVPEDWVVDHENFCETFMVVGAISGRGTLPLVRVPKKTKVNADYYVKHVLKPLVEVQLPKLYPGEMSKVVIHHDKASSHTARKTQDYARMVKVKYGITLMRNEDIPVKSPDTSPMDFFGFGYLKWQLFGHRPSTIEGVWKLLKRAWSKIDLPLINRTYDSWKRRVRAVCQKKGRHIENTKLIHKNFKCAKKLF